MEMPTLAEDLASGSGGCVDGVGFSPFSEGSWFLLRVFPCPPPAWQHDARLRRRPNAWENPELGGDGDTAQRKAAWLKVNLQRELAGDEGDAGLNAKD